MIDWLQRLRARKLGQWALAYLAGAWVADRYEVYLRPMGRPGPAIRISSRGGQEPIWEADGDAIYYRDMSGDSVYAVAFADGKPGRPTLLFTGSFLEGWPWGRNYDLAPDGRFLMVTESDDLIPAREIRVIRNWGARLHRPSAPG
ncbi:MAG TPA: hypothetical protein VK837_14490 [Longimicrobiales bacterium]|nr:hypothetical protein [Longimicrobiales bacterium]